MVDYLLTSTETTISRISSLIESFPKEIKYEKSIMLQLGNQICQSQKIQKDDSLAVEVLYKN
jgi:hypothetical protein